MFVEILTVKNFRAELAGCCVILPDVLGLAGTKLIGGLHLSLMQ